MSNTADIVPPVAVPRNDGWRISRGTVPIFGQYVDSRILLLAAADAVMLAVAIHLATLGWAWRGAALQGGAGSVGHGSILFTTCSMICLVAVGMYNPRLHQVSTAALARVLVGFLLAAGVMAALLFLIEPLHVAPGVLAAALLLSVLLLGISRVMFVPVFGRERLARRVLVYGCGVRASEVRAIRVRQDVRGFEVVGFVPTEGCPEHLMPEPRIAPPADLREFVLAHDIDEIIVALDDRRRGLPVEQLLSCRLAGIPVTDVLTFIERESGKVKLSMFYPSWLIYSDGVNRRGLVRVVTRLFDLGAALVLLVATLPVTLLAALAIWLESGCRGPVIYSQERVGLNGRHFVLHKLRTMKPDSEQNGPQWAIDNDPRITRIGSFLRRTRLDELPQLYNVLKGEMSFVGPRPERPEFVEELSSRIPYFRERHCVKPGITGWAQLCFRYGASEEDALEKLQYDLYYLKHKSLLFDFIILLQTAEVVLWRRGSR